MGDLGLSMKTQLTVRILIAVNHGSLNSDVERGQHGLGGHADAQADLFRWQLQ